jgi:hypothetical protein
VVGEGGVQGGEGGAGKRSVILGEEHEIRILAGFSTTSHPTLRDYVSVPALDLLQVAANVQRVAVAAAAVRPVHPFSEAFPSKSPSMSSVDQLLPIANT